MFLLDLHFTVFTFYTYREFHGFGCVWKGNEMLPIGWGDSIPTGDAIPTPTVAVGVIQCNWSCNVIYTEQY